MGEATATPPNGQQRAVRDDLVSLTYHRVRQAITSGALTPGMRVVERELGEKLGVSRTPVRSALHRLQQEGYIVAAGNGSAAQLVIAPLTRQDAVELFAMVGAIEGVAGSQAAALAPLARTRLVLELTQINRELHATAAAERPDQNMFYDLDSAFHLRYVDAAAGPRLRGLHEALKPQAERYARLYVSVLSGEIGASVREHELIIRAIDVGDPELARRRVETNWANACRRLEAVMSQSAADAAWPSAGDGARSDASGA